MVILLILSSVIAYLVVGSAVVVVWAAMDTSTKRKPIPATAVPLFILSWPGLLFWACVAGIVWGLIELGQALAWLGQWLFTPFDWWNKLLVICIHKLNPNFHGWSKA